MYVTQTEILAEIPTASLLEALDDDGDGVADANVWNSVAQSASLEVAARLAPVADLPDPTLETAPATQVGSQAVADGASEAVVDLSAFGFTATPRISASVRKPDAASPNIIGTIHSATADGFSVSLSGAVPGSGYSLDWYATAAQSSAAGDGEVPYVARAACRVFVLEKLWQRRGMGEKNPWSAQAEMWRTKLDRIGRGEEPLQASAQPVPDIPAPTRNFERSDQDGI